MKTSKFYNAFIWYTLLAVNGLIAQRAEEPDFRYDTGAKINEMKLTQGGTMVVATNDGLVGIRPGSNQLLFNFTEYGRVKPEELYFVPNAPYVMIFQGGFANITSKKTVIDYISGKTLFSTEGNGWKSVYGCDVIMPQNKLVVSGQRTSKEQNAYDLAVYDLNTAKEDYRFHINDPTKVGLASSGMALTGTPLLLKDHLIIPTNKGLMARKSQTGEMLWQNKMKNINWMVTDPIEKEIYGFESVNNGKNTRIHKVGVDGSELWKDDHKVKGQVVNFQILPNGIAVVSNQDDGGKNSVFARSNESNIAFLVLPQEKIFWIKLQKQKDMCSIFM